MDNVTAIVPQQHSAQLAPFFSSDQERIILNTFLGGATKEEAQVLLATVSRRRLDPFSKQVYFVKRWDAQKREEVWAIQTSIDGLRAIAERTGKYDGQDEPVYGEDEAGKFCKVKVYRKDWSSGRGVVGIAYLAEFIQKKKDGTITQFWARMPRLMLAKCAEALALRKAFPEDTAGLYIAEEMPEAAPVEAVQAAPQPAALPPAVEVLPPEPPKAAPQQPRPTPPHVVALWNRVREAKGEKGSASAKTRAAFEQAGRAIWGETPKPSNEWTVEDVERVETEILGPSDVPF